MQDNDASVQGFQQHPIRRVALVMAIIALLLPALLWLVIPPIGPQFMFSRLPLYPLRQAFSVVVPLVLALALLVAPQRYRPAYWILVLGFGVHLVGNVVSIVQSIVDPSFWIPVSGWISNGVDVVAFILLLLGGILRPAIPPQEDTLSPAELRT